MRSNSVRSQEEKGLFVLLEAVEEGRADLKLAGVAIDIHCAHPEYCLRYVGHMRGEGEKTTPTTTKKSSAHALTFLSLRDFFIRGARTRGRGSFTLLKSLRQGKNSHIYTIHTHLPTRTQKANTRGQYVCT